MIKKSIRMIYSRLYMLYLVVSKQCRFGNHGYVSFDSKFGGKNYIGKYSNIVHTSVGFGSNISDYADLCFTKLGKYCSIGKYVSTAIGKHPTQKFVSTHPAFYSVNKEVPIRYIKMRKFDDYDFFENENTSVLIGNDVWIGNHVVIVGKPKGISIGNGAVIGTGAVVTHSIPDYAIAAGVPAKIIRYRFNETDIAFLEELKWWDKDEHWFMKYAEYFDDISMLKEKINED